MSRIIWMTPSGSVGAIPEEGYYEFQLDSYDTAGSALTYGLVAGKLPGGLQLFKSGLIQGIPVIESETADTEFSSTFTIRASSAIGNISDRTFSITVNSIASPQIIPKNISLGTFFDGYFLDVQLTAIDQDPAAKLTWKLISGELPGGVTLASNGLLSGYIEPYVSPFAVSALGWSVAGNDTIPWDSSTATGTSQIYHFKVQVSDGNRYDETIYSLSIIAKGLFTADNTYINVDVNNIRIDTDNKHLPFLITSPEELLPQRQDSNFAFEFVGRDLDGNTLQYAIIQTDRVLFDQGVPTYADPINPGDPWTGPSVDDIHTDVSTETVGFDQYGFDQMSEVLPAGIGLDTIDNSIWSNSGWLFGHLGTQIEESKSYTFKVVCRKTDFPDFVSTPVTFTLTVLGAMDNLIEWITPSNLGEIDNGIISQISIQAYSTKGKTLNYRMKEPIRSPSNINIHPDVTVITYTPTARNELPQGLKLLPNGLIVGRPTFRYFMLDGGTTTIDKKHTDFDNVYTFTITATDEIPYNADVRFMLDGNVTTIDKNLATALSTASTTFDLHGTVEDEKTFTIRVNNYNIAPFENVYLKALPSRSQRMTFAALMNDPSIFPDQLMYRKEDPWFGKAKDIKFLFAAGLTPSTVGEYVTSIANNHYRKQISLRNVKTAIALDPDFNIMYEVVYIEVTDNNNTAVQALKTPFTVVYPNSLNNMKHQLTTVGYNNRGAIPDWMLDQQEDGRILGFTQGVVLAYTVPGASKLIAYRLNNKPDTFDINAIDFAVDRYQLDHYLSQFYDTAAKKFIPSSESTFDRLPPVGGLHPYAGTVDYAASIPFDEINGRTVDYINLNGGIDGAKNFKDGELLIFAKQEKYSTIGQPTSIRDVYDSSNFDNLGYNLSTVEHGYTSANDGWNIEQGLYGYLNYDTSAYAPSTIVPGYFEKLLSPISVMNERAGIWKITITEDGTVMLMPVYRTDPVTGDEYDSVLPNEYVQVGPNSGSFSETKLYYDITTKPGKTVPEYTVLTKDIAIASKTTRFDGGATKFYNYRDMYAVPQTGDVYIPFPKHNMLQ